MNGWPALLLAFVLGAICGGFYVAMSVRKYMRHLIRERKARRP